MGVTLGNGSAVNQVVKNLDALFSTSLAGYRKTMVDNIGSINAFFFEVMKKKLYKEESGSEIRVPLLYELGTADSYSGYDELPTTPNEGITQAVYEWRQAAAPIVISMKEIKQNVNKIVGLMDAKQKQAEMGFQEYFNRSMLWGALADGGNIYDPRVSGVNGSYSVDPLGKLVDFSPSSSRSVGGINQSTYSWWRNVTKTSAATTYDGLLKEFMNFHNTLSLGTGGRPDIYLVDQTTFELLSFAFYQRYRETKTDANYPFENIRWGNATIVMEDKVPDVYTGATSAATYGTIYGLNTQFMSVSYEKDSDFQLLRDENGKAFQKPTNQDARVAHLGWMGNTTVSNRRKQGVFGKIARTLTLT